MNHWCGTGNVSTEVVMRYTSTGKAVANFDIALNSYRKDSSATFIKVTVWDKLAEACEKNIFKGDKVAVEGRIQSDTYSSKKYPDLRLNSYHIEAYSVEFDPRNMGKKQVIEQDNMQEVPAAGTSGENQAGNEFGKEVSGASGQSNYEEDIPF